MPVDDAMFPAILFATLMPELSIHFHKTLFLWPLVSVMRCTSIKRNLPSHLSQQPAEDDRPG